MEFPEELRKCVAFAGYYDVNKKEHVYGTVFFVSCVTEESSYCYAVTARHIIDDIRKGVVNGKQIKKGKVCLRLNFNDGKARWRSMNVNKWLNHPDKMQYIDVAVCRFDLTEEDYDHVPFPFPNMDFERFSSTYTLPPDRWFSIGAEIAMPGLFWRHSGEHKALPIVRVGNIAAMADAREPVWTKFRHMEAYLIEARSTSGISGSPVFIRNEESGHRPREQPYATYWFAGLVHGHYDEKDAFGNDINIGIAVVVPRLKVVEALKQPMMEV